MRAKTLQIIWHEKQPVFSIDFHPDGYLATGGADREIKFWSLKCDGDGWPQADYLCCLAGHANTVNCVRFSPAGNYLASAGDSGEVLVWRPAPPGTAQARAFGEAPPPAQPDGGEPSGPVWKVAGSLRGHATDVMDVAWSPDGAALASGDVQASTHVFDVDARRSVAHLGGHRNYVQGVAWDPLGRFLVSMSSDRTARVHAPKALAPGSKKAQQLQQQGPPPLSVAAKDMAHVASIVRRPLAPAAAAGGEGGGGSDVAAVGDQQQPVAQPSQQQQQQKDSQQRQSQGEPAQQQQQQEPAEPPSAAKRAQLAPTQPLFQDESLPTFFRRLGWSPDGSLLALPAGVFRGAADAPSVLTTYLFARGEWSSPLAHLPAPGKAPVVARFHPGLFELRAGPGGVAPDPGPLGLPYRMVLAVATLDSVMLYDTQTLAPFVVLGPLHYAAITDLAWSRDGAFLAVSSVDGYCSAANFGEGELGAALAEDRLPPGLAAVRQRAEAAAAAAAAGLGAAQVQRSTSKPPAASVADEAPRAAGSAAEQRAAAAAAPAASAAAAAAPASGPGRRITPQAVPDPAVAAQQPQQQQPQQQQEAGSGPGRRITPQPAVPAAAAKPARRIVPVAVAAVAPAAAAPAAVLAPAVAAAAAAADAPAAAVAPRRIQPQRAAAPAEGGCGGDGAAPSPAPAAGFSVAMLAAQAGKAAALKRKQAPEAGADAAKKSKPDA